MSTQAPAALTHQDDRTIDGDNRDVDHNFLPDFAWAAVGGGIVVIACVLLLSLTASWSGGPPISSFTRELAGGFMAGFLFILVARSVSTRTH